MNKLFITLTALFFVSINSNAQKNFEGEVTYKLHASGEDKPDAELKVQFGKNAMKLHFKEREDYDKETILILFDSAAYYTLNTESRTFKKKMLAFKHAPEPIQNKKISGYNTSPLLLESNNVNQLLGGFMMVSNCVFYVADSLYFTIPPIFEQSPLLLAVQKNKIVLGAEIAMQTGAYESADTSKYKTLITAEAIQVKPMLFHDSVFTVPPDFTDSKYIAAYDYMSDTAAVVVDSPAVVTPVKKPTKKPIKPSSKKTPVKPAAVRRKQ